MSLLIPCLITVPASELPRMHPDIRGVTEIIDRSVDRQEEN